MKDNKVEVDPKATVDDILLPNNEEENKPTKQLKVFRLDSGGPGVSSNQPPRGGSGVAQSNMLPSNLMSELEKVSAMYSSVWMHVQDHHKALAELRPQLDLIWNCVYVTLKLLILKGAFEKQELLDTWRQLIGEPDENLIQLLIGDPIEKTD